MIGVLPRSFLGGVTRSLNISYLKAIPVGTSLYSVKQAFPAPPFQSISHPRPLPCFNPIPYRTPLSL